MSEIWQLSAAEMARRIAHRELSSVEVVDAHLLALMR
jgi:amidase